MKTKKKSKKLGQRELIFLSIFNSLSEYELEALNEFVTINFAQKLIDGSLKIQLDVNEDIVIDDLENASPLIFPNLKIFAGEECRPTAPSVIRNLRIREIFYTGK